MRFVCDSCRAQYMISDDKVGSKGVKVRCKKCGFVILVRKGAEAAPTAPQEAFDPEATQVMQNPMDLIASAGAGAKNGEAPAKAVNGVNGVHGTNGVNGHKPADFLASVADDEIGAVFDQVLSGGSDSMAGTGASAPPSGSLGADDDDDDHQATRVLDRETMAKLAEEARENELTGADEPKTVNGATAHEWFVAIDEKQVGPLQLEKVRELWDSGEIGPDSLCWRAGLADWQPLSEVSELAGQLAPKPAKPLMGSVMTVPVESSFASNGVMQTVRSEVPVLTAGGLPSAESTGAWKPSAASALASLAKEEIDVLSKPAPKKKPVDESGKGLLDLPAEEHSDPAKALITTPLSGRNPVLADGGMGKPIGNFGPAAAPYATYRPPSSSKKWAVLGSVAAVVVVGLLGTIVWLLAQGRVGGTGTGASVQVATVQPTPVSTGAKLQMPPPPPGMAPVAPLPAPPPSAAAPRSLDAVAKSEGSSQRRRDSSDEASGRRRASDTVSASGSSGDGEMTFYAPGAKPKKVAEPSSDDFDELFPGETDKKEKTAAAAKKEKAPEVYIPPPPGQADIPASLGQSDIMQVALSNRAAIKKCVDEQKKRDPDITGKLVMKWTILTSGRTSSVSVQSDEFKDTYMATCIAGLVKGWSFPRHKTQGEPILFPFTF